MSRSKSATRSKRIQMSEFTLKVLAVVKKIPRGKVATYGQVATLAGKPHAARGVGWILNSCSETHRLPWQRVLNSQGKISFHPKLWQYTEQRRLLQKEGVQFLNKDSLDLQKYQWKKRAPRPQKNPQKPSLFR